MIIQFEQVLTNFHMTWVGTRNEQTRITAFSPFEKGRLRVSIDYPDQSRQWLYHEPNRGTSLRERLSFHLYEGERKVSSICELTRKQKGFLQSYAYRTMEYQGLHYDLYEVGFGHKGLYLCIYRETELIAIAEKELTTINYKDRYTIYSLDGAELKAIIPLLLHYDLTQYGDMMDISLYSKKKRVVNTIQRELKAKYDPLFIERVREDERRK